MCSSDLGAPAWLGRPAGAGADLTERGRYVVGRHDAGRSAGSALGWSIVVRQSSEAALRQAQALGHAVLVTVLAAGLLAALAALALTHWLTLRLGGLSAQAHAIREGRRSSIEVPPGRDEISAIGATMAALVGQLQHEKSALATLNAELDARCGDGLDNDADGFIDCDDFDCSHHAQVTVCKPLGYCETGRS